MIGIYLAYLLLGGICCAALAAPALIGWRAFDCWLSERAVARGVEAAMGAGWRR